MLRVAHFSGGVLLWCAPLNNNIKRLKMKKIEFEISGEKILKLDTYRRITLGLKTNMDVINH